ncbi:MAG: hypothetical protein GWO20_03310, partial [Candidatus Korarchaeota archaeon]|nr:hypothetical protein [Candidatus Korarchaeota archaeon]NIU81902.1 hypothetical protein [Candidatus Thorarchaeota archaeon]NIW12360.1 hypothetical protein [Candidatus Thorarchaeota archaeon]NIW51152.1 hypothetical protein [Candidatus Korarchaeota archaeon]
SAFRLGRVECHGSITVIGSESGGGIIGVNFRGEPMFGLSQQFLRRSNGATQYYFNPHLLSEITHVFPTLTGRIGYITWSGHNSSLVGEIVRFPEKQEASYILTFNRKSQTYFEDLSPIAAGGWDEIHIGIKNTGDCALTFEVIGYMTPVLLKDSHPHHGRFKILTGKIPAGKTFTKSFSKPFQFYVVRVKSRKKGDLTTYHVYVTKRSL